MPLVRKEIPDGGSFCFSCARPQEEKQEAEVPSPRSKLILAVCAVLLIIIAAAAAVMLFTGKQTVDNGGAEVVYRQNGSVWHVLLRNAAADNVHWQTAQDTYQRVVTEDTTGAIPLQLYAYDEKTGESRAEQLTELIERSEITVTAAEGSNPADYGTPDRNPGFPGAALVADIIFDPSCSDNDIAWTLYLKNGDRLVLHEHMQISVMKKEEYSWRTVSLSTSEELQELIASADAGEGAKEIYI